MGCNLRDLANSKSIALRELSGQRVAIDTFLVAYQFITSIRARGEGQDGGPLRDSKGRPISHLMGFLDRATVMIENGIDPIFIFDGHPHDLKNILFYLNLGYSLIFLVHLPNYQCLLKVTLYFLVICAMR